MKKTINIDFDNSSSVLLGYHPDILGPNTTAFAVSTHSHGPISLDLDGLTGTYTSVSNGLTLALTAAGGTADNVVYAGNNITLSTTGVSTTVSVYGLADETHIHGGTAFASGNIAGTIDSTGWSLSIPDFLLTQNITDHSHTNYIGLDRSTATITGTNLTFSDDSVGLSISYPRFLTTAANSTHTHGSFLGTNITQISSGSGGLALSVADKMGTATSISTITGSSVTGLGNTSGLTLGIPNFLTTAAQVSHTHGSVNTIVTAGTAMQVTSASSGLTLGMPLWITTAAQSDHTHGDISLALSGLSGNYSSVSSGLTISLTNSTHAHPYAGTQTSATNVGISVDSNGISVSLDTAGLTSFGDGVNILAVPGSTMGTNATVVFSASNGISFGLDGSTLTASYSQSTHEHSTLTFAGSDHTHGSLNLSLSNIDGSYSSASNGLTISLTGSTHDHPYASSDHSHGDVSLSLVNIDGSYSSASSGLTLSFTGSTHDHPYINTSISSDFAGTNLSVGTVTGSSVLGTLNSSGLTLDIPAFITTAAMDAIEGIQVSDATFTSGTVHFINTNSISFGSYSANAISASYELITHTHPYAGTTTAATNVGLTVDNSGIRVSLDTAGLTDGIADGVNILAVPGTTASSNVTVVFSNSNRVSFGMSDHTITASIREYIGTGFTTTATAGTELVGTANSDGLKLGVPAYITTAALTAIEGIIVSDATYSSGSVSFSNANNISFGSSGAGVVTASYSLLDHSHTQYVGLLSTGVTGASATLNNSQHYMNIPQGSLYYVDGGGITWGASSDGLSTTITATVAGGTGTYTGGVNIADSAATFTSGTVVFSNSNGISFGLSSNTMTASWASNDYLGTPYLNYFQATSDNSASAARTHTHGTIYTSQITGTVITNSSTSSGLTLGIPAYLTTAAQISHTHGNISTVSTGGTATNMSFSSTSNGLTISVPPYAVTSHTHSNLYAAIGHTHGSNVSLSTINLLGASASSASNGLTLSISGYPSSSFVNTSETGNLYIANTSCSNITFSSTVSSNSTYLYAIAGGGTGTAANGTLEFINTHGVSFISSSAGSTTSVSASVETAYVPLANSTRFGQVWQLTGNTLGTTSSSFGSALKLQGGNYITVSGDTAGNIVIQGNAGTGGGGGAVSAFNGSFTFDTLSLGTGNGFSFYTSNSSILGSYTVPASGTLSYINTNGVSFISSSAGSTTSISASVETAYVPLANSTSFNQVWKILQSGGSTAGTSSSAFGSVLNIVAGSGITLSGGSGGITVLA